MLKNKHIEVCPNCIFNNRFRTTKNTEAIYKYRTNTGKMTASDYTHLFGYLNPYYRSAYNIPKRRK